MNNFNNIVPYSFNNQFMWAGEYLNDTLFFEYDKESLKQNNYYNIDKNNLKTFGMVGYGYKFYFDINNGIYNINNNEYEIIYEDEHKNIYNLTNNNFQYNDIIQYKDSSIILKFGKNQTNGTGVPNIEKYNFGYKTICNINNIKFNIKTIVHIPMNNKPISLGIRIVTNKDFKGNLIIRKNKIQEYKYFAPLKENIGGEIEWVVR